MAADRFNEGKPQISLVLDAGEALKGIAKVLEFGAKKYDRRNWKKGLPVTQVIDSLMRHLIELSNGNLIDEESGLPHSDLVATNALFLSEMMHTRPEFIDLPGVEK
jgi:hypothetical protein